MKDKQDEKLVYILSCAVGFWCEVYYMGNKYQIMHTQENEGEDGGRFFYWYATNYPGKQWHDNVIDACHSFLIHFMEWRNK